MICEKLINKMYENLGMIELTAEEKSHVDNCENCRQTFDELTLMESSLEAPAPTMSAAEFALMQEKLDTQISDYRTRAFGLYDWMVRYGVSAAAAVVIFAISMVSTLNPSVTVETAEFATITSDYYSVEYISSDDIDLDEDYYDLVADDFQGNYSANSTDLLIGEIDESEYEYLIENIKVGDML